MMLAAERRDLLVSRLHRDGKLVARSLAQELGLSEDSLRRDLREMAAAGLCQRVYGGALPLSPATGAFHARLGVATESKRKVAVCAATLISPGTTAILGGGTTALAVASALAPDLAATIVTPSPATAAALVNHATLDVFMLGGRLLKQAASVCGAATAEAASKISADLYLLGVAGIHPKEGCTTGDPDEAAMERILVGRAADTYVLASSEKLGTLAPYRVIGLSEAAAIITDARPDHPTVRQLKRRGVEVIHAR
jgi:DeoR/GlpR family transcriptional regulator of sugar metabolism